MAALSLHLSVIEEDREFLADYFEIEEELDFSKLSPWLLRIELDAGRVNDKSLGGWVGTGVRG